MSDPISTNHRPASRRSWEPIKRSEHVIPAAPGWYVVTPWTDSNGRITELHNDPVVAWRIGLFERGDKSTFQPTLTARTARGASSSGSQGGLRTGDVENSYRSRSR